MTNPRSPALLLKRVLSATYGCGIDNLFIPQGFFPSKIYKEILAHLDPVNIPTTPPFGHAEWLKIINALEHIAAVVQLFVAAEHPATPDYIEPRIIADTFPSIWKWLVFLHPNSGYFDDDEFYAAAARYGWSRYAVATTGYPCVRAVLWTFFTLLPRSPRRIAAALEIPELPMHLFDLWWSYTSRLPLDQPSDRCTAGLLQALTHFFCDNEPLYTRFADELFSYKGEATMRAIVRRLRYVVRMPEPLFLEMGSILELFLILARFPKFRPVLRPTISLIVPLMDLVNHPGAAQFEAEFMPLMPDENCTLKMHVSNSCLLLDRLSTELRGPRDIARIIRSGFLRALYQHLRTYRVPQMEKCVVAQACSRIVGPGLLFPCVARAVEQAIARENLPRKVKGGLPGFDAWNDMCRILSERAQYEQDFRLQTMALRYCHNPTVRFPSFRVLRD
ncbi:hypothetical protein HDZ31DRAFT_39667 [Schizophyllum fasciatum]